jgi:hypothetical protein
MTSTLLHVTDAESKDSTVSAMWRHILIDDVYIYRIDCYSGLRYCQQLSVTKHPKHKQYKQNEKSQFDKLGVVESR